MIEIYGVSLHLLSTIGFVLALILLAHVVRQRRSPTSTLAWLLAIVFIPYVGVPFYLIFGGRKMRRKAAAKPLLSGPAPVPGPEKKSIHPAAAQSFEGLFPVTSGNHIELYADGEQAYLATLELVADARESICAATFILGQDHTGEAIVAALTDKVRKGVRVYFLLDALGSVKINRKFLSPLLEAGGRTAFFMPMLHLPFRGRANLRNHRKMVIVDDRSAIVGGMNMAAEYMGPGKSTQRWQDLSLFIEGPACRQIGDIFRSDWRFAAGGDLEWTPRPETAAGSRAGHFIQVMASGPDVETDNLRDGLISHLFHARSRVWVVTPYFVPDELLLEALCLAVKRGIDLRLVIPKKSNHLLADLAREGYLSQLQECGASIHLYTPGMLHAKALIMDDNVAITGSANMDMRSLLLNYELALVIYSRDVVGHMEGWMKQLMARSVERIPHRNQMLSLLEGVGRLFAPLL